MTSYVQRERSNVAGIASVVVHALLIGAWTLGTLPPSLLPADGLLNRLYYIPPPNKPPPSRGARETVRYVVLDQGTGIGPGRPTIDARKPFTPPQASAEKGGVHPDSLPPPPSPAPAPVAAPKPSIDSVFTELEVDSTVVRSQMSAAPAYPLDLLEKHVEGMALVRYVVDTTGFADTHSFTVIRATDSGFVRAVRDALPYMRFSPAKIGAKKVRQMVEQPFTFKIAPAAAAVPKR